mmetsp:Transcript_18925/g.22605  ORF Transcript_18925/g.22605 Transcript_18925/m.22605 type:complete len:265 (-) Transcript_18925:249-1043(-)
MFKKTILLFLFCQMAKAAANDGELQNGINPLSISPEDIDALVGLDDISEQCANGTIALNLIEDVQDALTPFYVGILESIIPSPNTDSDACDSDFSFTEGLKVSCRFDFSAMTVEHTQLKNTCEDAGGKVFLFDLDLSIDTVILDVSLVVSQFPLCIDQDCDIDGIGAFEEKKVVEVVEQANVADNAVNLRITPTCVEQGSTRFFLKKKTIEGRTRKKIIKKKCEWLEMKSDTKKDKICKKTKPTKRFKRAREVCPESCCGITLE